MSHGLILRLKQLEEKKEHLEQATIIANCLDRLIAPKPGRPRVKKVTWDSLLYYTDYLESYLPELFSRA